MRLSPLIWILAAVGLAALGVACGGSDSPTGPNGDSVYSFDPKPGDYAVDVFDNFQVQVRDSSGAEVSGVFYVDGEQVAMGSSYSLWASKLGRIELKVVLPPESDPVEAIWTLNVSEGESTPPNAVSQLSSGRGEVPGSVNLNWERPARDYEIIAYYRVFYDTSPIDPLQLESIPYDTVPHQSGFVQQTHRLEGLEERVVYYIRIQIVDLIGRETDLSPQVSSLSTGHYEVSGRVTRLVENAGGAEGFSAVLIEMGDHKILTDADGYYTLPNIPDVFESRLSAKPTTQVFSYYSVLTDTLETVDRTLDLLLIRRSLVQLDNPVEEIFMLQYLFQVAAKDRVGHSSVVQRWESYPIPVCVDPYVVEGGGDIGASLALGIEAWNSVAQEPLLVGVSGVPSYGAEYGTVPSQPSGALGEVVVRDPNNPQCLFECVPYLVRVQMSVANTPSVMDRVAVHELGHVLWLTHSRNSTHVLSEGVISTSPLTPHPHEVLAARYIKHIPNGTDLRWYQEPGGS